MVFLPDTLNEAQQLHYEAPKLTIGRLAELVGVSRPTYHRWLNGGPILAEHKMRLKDLLTTRDFSSLPRKPQTSSIPTRRERSILRLIAQGYRDADIACSLTIEGGTVRAHIKNILEKTRLSNRTELAIYAIKKGIIRLDEIELRYVERKGADL